jgi:hypothetical protein
MYYENFPPGITSVDVKDFQWVTRYAGFVAMFEWQDGPFGGVVSATSIVGKVGDLFIVLVEGISYDDGMPFAISHYYSVRGTEKCPHIDDATGEQIAGCLPW